MPKTWILAIFGYCIFLGNLASQTIEANPHIIIETSRPKTLYVGIENELNLFFSGSSPIEYTVTSDKGKLKRSRKGQYTLKVQAAGDVTISVLVDGVVKQKETFKAINIPNPTPIFGSYQASSDTVSMGLFKATRGLRLEHAEPAFQDDFKVTSYRIIQIGTHHVDGKLFMETVYNRGNMFSEDAIFLTAMATNNDIYIFDEIKVKCRRDGTVRTLTPMVYYMEPYTE